MARQCPNPAHFVGEFRMMYSDNMPCECQNAAHYVTEPEVLAAIESQRGKVPDEEIDKMKQAYYDSSMLQCIATCPSGQRCRNLGSKFNVYYTLTLNANKAGGYLKRFYDAVSSAAGRLYAYVPSTGGVGARLQQMAINRLQVLKENVQNLPGIQRVQYLTTVVGRHFSFKYGCCQMCPMHANVATTQFVKTIYGLQSVLSDVLLPDDISVLKIATGQETMEVFVPSASSVDEYTQTGRELLAQIKGQKLGDNIVGFSPEVIVKQLMPAIRRKFEEPKRGPRRVEVDADDLFEELQLERQAQQQVDAGEFIDADTLTETPELVDADQLA